MEAAYEMLASRRILVVDKGTFDAMFMKAFPAQRTLEITLPIPAVFKDGVFYIPYGSLAIKYPEPFESGHYALGIEMGVGSDESVAVVLRVGENGEPDREVAIFRMDKVSGKWVQQGYELFKSKESK